MDQKPTMNKTCASKQNPLLVHLGQYGMAPSNVGSPETGM